jgi:hypothetical protein
MYYFIAIKILDSFSIEREYWYQFDSERKNVRFIGMEKSYFFLIIYFRMVELGHGKLDRDLELKVGDNVGPLIQTLTKMDSLFGTCLIKTEAQDQRESPPISLYVPYTDTEEAWLQFQFKLLQNQNLSVTLPVEFLEEYISLLAG